MPAFQPSDTDQRVPSPSQAFSLGPSLSPEGEGFGAAPQTKSTSPKSAAAWPLKLATESIVAPPVPDQNRRVPP